MTSTTAPSLAPITPSHPLALDSNVEPQVSAASPVSPSSTNPPAAGPMVRLFPHLQHLFSITQTYTYRWRSTDNQVHVRALVISGQNHVFNFEPELTVGRMVSYIPTSLYSVPPLSLLPFAFTPSVQSIDLYARYVRWYWSNRKNWFGQCGLLVCPFSIYSLPFKSDQEHMEDAVNDENKEDGARKSWPLDWTEPSQPPSPSYLRILHAGRILQDDTTLSCTSTSFIILSRSPPVNLSTDENREARRTWEMEEEGNRKLEMKEYCAYE